MSPAEGCVAVLEGLVERAGRTERADGEAVTAQPAERGEVAEADHPFAIVDFCSGAGGPIGSIERKLK